MKILLTGKHGQVGWELQRVLGSSHDIIAVDADEMDLSQPDALVRTVREVQPELIINPAAYTAVDKAETETQLAMAVNGDAPRILAEEAKTLGIPLIHYSTDYVYDGSNTQPYREGDAPNPQSVYGKTKLAGDQAVAASGARHLILRTSWVYGVHGGNFMKTILRLAKERDELRIIADQFGAPTWARLLAQSTAHILQQWQSNGFDAGQEGLYHLTAGGRTSWHAYASEVVRLARQYDPSLDKPLQIHPIATSEYPLPAPRPANSVLSTDKIRQTFGVQIPDWQEDLARCVRELYQTT